MIGRRLTHDDQDVAEGAALAVRGLQRDLVGALVLARDLGEVPGSYRGFQGVGSPASAPADATGTAR